MKIIYDSMIEIVKKISREHLVRSKKRLYFCQCAHRHVLWMLSFLCATDRWTSKHHRHPPDRCAYVYGEKQHVKKCKKIDE